MIARLDRSRGASAHWFVQAVVGLCLLLTATGIGVFLIPLLKGVGANGDKTSFGAFVQEYFFLAPPLIEASGVLFNGWLSFTRRENRSPLHDVKWGWGLLTALGIGSLSPVVSNFIGIKSGEWYGGFFAASAPAILVISNGVQSLSKWAFRPLLILAQNMQLWRDYLTAFRSLWRKERWRLRGMHPIVGLLLLVGLLPGLTGLLLFFLPLLFGVGAQDRPTGLAAVVLYGGSLLPSLLSCGRTLTDGWMDFISVHRYPPSRREHRWARRILATIGITLLGSFCSYNGAMVYALWYRHHYDASTTATLNASIAVQTIISLIFMVIQKMISLRKSPVKPDSGDSSKG